MSWKAVALGDVCNITGGGTPSKANANFYTGDIPWATVRDMNRDYLDETDFKITNEAVKNSSTNIIPKNNVIIATRVGLGKVCILKQDTAINQDLRGVVPKNEKLLDVQYLFYWFKSISKTIVDAGRGATVHGVTLPFIRSLQIPLPSLSIQKKIVAKLDAIFAEIDKAAAAAENNAKNAEALFQSYLTEVFESGGEGWITKSLLELANEDCSLSYGIVQPGEDFENGLPIVRPTNLTKKYISKFELKTINPALANSYKRTTLTGEELLLCVRGTTGTVSISTEELKGCNVTRGIVPIRFKDKEIDLDYAYYFFNSSVAQKQIKAKTYGAALLQINIADIKKLHVVVPKLVEQKKIVIKLNSIKQHIDSLINSQNNKIKNIVNFKNSILKQAFSGELVKE